MKCPISTQLQEVNMSTYNKTIVAYCSTIIASLALYYVAFGALSERLLNELNVKDKFAYLVSDATALICLTVIGCAVGHCCSVVINHLVCVRNNERRIRAERAEVDAQVSEAQSEIALAMEESRKKAIRKEALRREFGGDGLTVEVGTSAPERDAPITKTAEVSGLADSVDIYVGGMKVERQPAEVLDSRFPPRGSEAWTVGSEPMRQVVGTGRITPDEFRKQYMTDVSDVLDSRLSYFQVADLVMWWLNLSAGYATRNDVSCAIRGLAAYNMITDEEGRWFISAYRNICSLKQHD